MHSDPIWYLLKSTYTNWKSNAECCEDYKQKKKLSNGSLREKERKRVNGYRAKKKENQSKAQTVSQHEKIDLQNRNTVKPV